MKPPTDILVRRTRERQATYTVKRPSATKDSMGGTNTSYSNLSRSLVLHGLTERTVQTDVGERHVGVLEGMKLPSVDVDYDDRVEYDGGLYELQSITGIPTDDNPSVHELEFERVVEST